jgi:hypothetical protein
MLIDRVCLCVCGRHPCRGAKCNRWWSSRGRLSRLHAWSHSTLNLKNVCVSTKMSCRPGLSTGYIKHDHCPISSRSEIQNGGRVTSILNKHKHWTIKYGTRLIKIFYLCTLPYSFYSFDLSNTIPKQTQQNSSG